jgi:putative FmdB family regulatory protein
MPTYEWVCNECHIYWDRELSIGTAPKRTKCPKCGKLSNRYWQNQGVNVKWGDDQDFHTVRARHEKHARLGYDKTAGDRFLRGSIEGTKRAMNDETQRYSQMDIDWDKMAKSRGLEKVGDREARNKMERSRKLTAEAYDRANKMGYKDIGQTGLDIAKPEKNNPVKPPK